MYNSYKVIMIPAKHFILFYIQPIGTSCWCWLFINMSKDIRLKKNSLCGTNWGPDRPLTLRLVGFYTSFTCSQTQGHFLRWFPTWLQQPIQPFHRWSFRLLHPDVWFCQPADIPSVARAHRMLPGVSAGEFWFTGSDEARYSGNTGTLALDASSPLFLE